MDGSEVRTVDVLGITNDDHGLYQYLVNEHRLDKVIKQRARAYSNSRKDREDELVQALTLEALEYCAKPKRAEETIWQAFTGLKTRLKNEAMRVSVNLSGAVEKPDGKKQRRSRRELQHGDEQTKVDPDRIYGNMTYLPSDDPDPNSRYGIDARYLQTNYLAFDKQNDRLLDLIDFQRVWLGLPFYTNCKLDKYERIHLLFDRMLGVEHTAELLKIQRKTLQNWYDRTCDRYPYFDHKRNLKDRQHEEIAKVRSKWKHIK
jgi:hypothetical protein